MIKVVNLVSYNLNFIPWGYLPLPLGFVHVLNPMNLHMVSFLKPLANIGPSVEVVLRICSNAFSLLNKMATMPIFGKNT